MTTASAHDILNRIKQRSQNYVPPPPPELKATTGQYVLIRPNADESFNSDEIGLKSDWLIGRVDWHTTSSYANTYSFDIACGSLIEDGWQAKGTRFSDNNILRVFENEVEAEAAASLLTRANESWAHSQMLDIAAVVTMAIRHVSEGEEHLALNLIEAMEAFWNQIAEPTKLFRTKMAMFVDPEIRSDPT